MKEPLFTWNNFKFVCREMAKIYSHKPSYFSKKRLESGAAFAISQYMMISFFMFHFSKMDVYECIAIVSVELLICGYMVKQIQKEKPDNRIEK